jgi:hypothetical protein
MENSICKLSLFSSFCIDVTVAINLSFLFSKNEIQKDILFPGDKVEVFFDLDSVCWI